MAHEIENLLRLIELDVSAAALPSWLRDAEGS
jgi:hypothetical protein